MFAFKNIAMFTGVFLLLLITFVHFYHENSFSNQLAQPRRANRTTPSGPLLNLLPMTTLRPGYVERYVTFGQALDDGRRLGNQLFNFAAMLYVAELTGRRPAFFNLSYITDIEKFFNVQVPRYNKDLICPCRSVGEALALVYSATEIEELAFRDNEHKTILIVGFFQSWKYLRTIKRQLLKQLEFKKEIATFVDQFLSQNIPKNWIKGFIRVGIHVRRGDIVSEKRLVEFGYTVPDAAYFKKAMTHFAESYRTSRIQFIVASDDIRWCQENLNPIVMNGDLGSNHSIIYSIDHSNGEDMAILASCDHVIISTGSFGWWAAWFAGGTTIYYANWPRNGSVLASQFSRHDYFPPSWIGM